MRSSPQSVACLGDFWGPAMGLKIPHREFRERGVALSAAFALIFSTNHSLVWANPSGPEVVYGSAVFDENGSDLAIRQNSGQLIIDWQDFSIADGELTRFVQPSSGASALNRVVSGNLSQIQGQLQANGNVYLINPNGIIVGETARIDVGSFTASTLDLENSDFLDGDDLSFRATGSVQGEIVNLGRIEALSGDVTLIAEVIRNEGILFATDGSVNLAAGTQVLLKPQADRPIYISMPSDRASIENTGRIEAARSEILASHSNPFALAINQGGVVRATGTEEIAGEVWLVADSGTVEISGTVSAQNVDWAGGDIFASGSRIGIYAGSEIAADGDHADGGRVRIGGSRRGQDSSVVHADQTYVEAGARISADSSGAENAAGTIIVWGNDTLRMYGDLSARGIEAASGGFIETSAGWFDLGQNIPDVGSDSGQGGEWLIDPYNIVITDNGVDEFDDTSDPFDNPNTDDAEIDVDTLLAALTSGSGVTVTVETGGAGSQDGKITIDTDIDYNGIGTGDTLWLRAIENIEMSSGVGIFDGSGSDDSLNVVFQSDLDDSGDGAIWLQTGSSITTNGGEIIFSGGNGATLNDLRTTGLTGGSLESFGRGIRIDNADLNTGMGNITMRAEGSYNEGIQLRNTASLLTTTGNITLYGEVPPSNDTGIIIDKATITSDGGDVSITGVGDSSSSTGDKFAHGVEISGGADISLTGDSTLTITGTGSQRSLDSANYGVVVEDSGTVVSVENGDLTITATGGTGASSYGFALSSDAVVESTGTGGISIVGSGSDTYGVFTDTSTTLTLGGSGMSGDISISAETTSGSDSILLDSDLVIQTTGSVTFASNSASDTMGLGDGATGVLNLDAGELDTVNSAVSVIIFGRTDGSAAIDVESHTFADDVKIQNGSGDIDFDGAFSVGSANLAISAIGTTTQSASITAGGLQLSGSGTKTLENAGNDVDTLAASGGEFSFVDSDDLVIGSVSVDGTAIAGIGLDASQDLSLNIAGALTQTESIVATGLVLLGSGSKTLQHASNDVDNIAGSGGSIIYDDSDDLAINAITVNGTTTTGVALSADGTFSSAGDFTISSSSDINGTGTGNTLWLKSTADILMTSDNTIEDSSGNDDSISIVFQADSDGSGLGGIQLSNDAGFSTNGGEVILSGGNYSTLDDLRTIGYASGTGDSDNSGVRLRRADIITGVGNITIRGQGRTNHGVRLANGFTLQTTTGDITIYGEATSTDDAGIRLDDTGGITSAGGDVALTGIGSSSGSGSTTAHGVELSADIVLTGDSSLTIIGTASQAGTDDDYGVLLSETEIFSVENGDITITGTGGTGANGYGVYIKDTATVRSTGSGSISISGTSNGASAGIFLDPSSATTLGGSAMTGDLTLEAATNGAADSIVMTSNLSIETSGAVYFRPGNTASSIGIGDTSTGVFNVDSTELGLVQDGATAIVLGRTDGTGAIDVEDITFTDDVLIQSLSGDIDIDGALDLGVNSLSIDTGGTVTQAAAITANGLQLMGAGSKSLENTANDISVLAAEGGSVSWVDQDDFQIGSLSVNGDAVVGISLTGSNLTLGTTGTVSQSQTVLATVLELNGSGATYTLDNSSNNVGTLLANTGVVELNDIGGLAIGSFTANSLDVVSSGAITNTGAIAVSGNATFKTLDDSGAAITLDNAGNTFGSIAAQSRNGADSLNAAGDISITETGSVVIAAIASSGDFTLTADADVTQTGGIQVDRFIAIGSGSYTLENSSNTVNSLGNIRGCLQITPASRQ
ncbi:MAG: beta strand repeat-containing protein [Opitutales bacterium]